MSKYQTEMKSEQLMNRVYEISHSGKINELALQRVAEDVKPLAHVDPANYENIMGAIACVREDVAAMRKYFNNAIKKFPGIAESHYNFANSLSRLNFEYEALFQLDKALEIRPSYQIAKDLKNSILDAIEKRMWCDMESDTEDELLGFCMNSTSSLDGDDFCEGV